MKRIVILCDGTWNTADAKHPTHLVRLARALAPQGPDGVVQVPIYVEGVGTGRGVTIASRVTDRVLGGTMGHGLLANVIEAYQHLVFLYEPDDEIYIFGFSRGAFTARSLAGLIYQAGILDRDSLHLLPDTIETYRKGAKTKSPERVAFRAQACSRAVTTPEDLAYRQSHGMAAAPYVNLNYIGVWDTVGALGVPRDFPFSPLFNRKKYQFHDTQLSPLVKRARHAVALDERRTTFEPTLWTLKEGEREVPLVGANDDPRQQRYFAGDHGTVGGSTEDQRLASYTLDWIMQGAEDGGLGLHFDPTARAAIRDGRDPFGSIHSSDPDDRSAFQKFLYAFSRDRVNRPKGLNQLHPAVIRRWWRDPVPAGEKPYRPGSLDDVHQELAALPPQAREEEEEIFVA